jgi:hypothetical protein
MALHRYTVMKTISKFALALTTLAAFGFTYNASITNIEVAEDQVRSGFDELERLNAYIVNEKGEKLGRISRNSFDKDSLANTFGAGSQFKSDGLFNTFSKYGNQFDETSAYSLTAPKPPRIVYKVGSTVHNVGVLTVNKAAETSGQRIHPELLKFWINTR